ncbi:MAG TPA: HIT family protein [Vicinamibacteria bacterium]|nr:HIT family protein [Vicinamibacteria bacterium]
MSGEPTVFDKIIRGEIPSHKIYEDELVYAFLDIAPLSRGHTLVVPKESKAFFHELSDDSAAALGRALPRICHAVVKATGATAYNILQNNGSAAHQAVFHVHLHIIPRYEKEGLGIGWNSGKLEEAAAKELVRSITRALEEKGSG